MSAPATNELPGTAERAAARARPPQGPRAGAAAAGSTPAAALSAGAAFALHRLTGLALVVYLYVHLGVLSMLLDRRVGLERLPRAS